jgi:excisionase family DNA binding protein
MSDRTPPPLDLARAPQWLRIDQVAKLAHVTPRTIRRWVSSGLLRATKPGGRRILVERDSLVERLEAGRVR